jgi:hypothetical protein
MHPRLRPNLGLVSCAALLAVFATTDVASALPRELGPEPLPTKGDPTDSLAPPSLPSKPPLSCAAPTLKDCTNVAYLATACGAATKAACGDLVAPLYQAEVRALPETTQILKGSGAFGKLQTAKKLAPIAMPARKFSLGSLSFATAAQIGRTLPPSADTATLTPQHPTYEANGAVVASCQEYAYESLYDHERFVEAAETCGSNAECVYQLSLRTETPGLKSSMLKKNGQPMATQVVRTGAYSQLKNAFFVPDTEALRSHPSYASSAAFRAKAEAIIAHVNGTAKATATSELAWHRSMHDVFAANPSAPAELSSIKQRVETYSQADLSLRVANFAIALLEAVIPGQSGDARARSEALLAQYQAQKTQAIQQMAPLLMAEWDHVSATDGVTLDRGCLSRTSVRCDWSPQRFVSRYAGHLRHESETLFSACVEATAGNFAKVPAAYTASTDTLAAWIAAQSLPKLGTQIVGERMSDGDEWGDRQWFAAGYTYDAGWSLAAERQSGSNRICKLKGGAYASGSATAYALDNAISVLDTQHKLSVRESGDAITLHSHLRMVGQDIYTPIDKNLALPSATPVDEHYQTTLAQRTYTKWFTIAGVGVKLQAKTELKAGADLTARATAASGCNPDNLAYDAALSVKPWIDVHVVPEVSVGIGIIQGGVRGDVDLVKIATPASGSVKLVGGVNDITLQLRANAALDIDALDGTIDVFLESCLPLVGCTDLASKQIYAWDGYSWHLPMFAYSKDVKINVFDAATNPSPSNPGTVGTIGTVGVLGMAKL